MGSRMKNFNATLLYSFLALSFLASSHAQPPAPAVTAVDPLQACEATSTDEYKLGDGDQISVDVNNGDPNSPESTRLAPMAGLLSASPAQSV
jgi:hypothetical protein